MKLNFQIIIFSTLMMMQLNSHSQMAHPYIKTMGGDTESFSEVKLGYAKIRARNGKEKWTKFKKKELSSAYSTRGVVQYVFLKLKKTKLIKNNYEVLPGRWVYEVFMSNGKDHIITRYTTSGPTYSANPGGAAMGGTWLPSSGVRMKAFYLVEGRTAKHLIGVEWFQKDFLEKLENLFGGCEGVSEVLAEYKDANAKIFKLPKFMKALKQCYRSGCFLEI